MSKENIKSLILLFVFKLQCTSTLFVLNNDALLISNNNLYTENRKKKVLVRSISFKKIGRN